MSAASVLWLEILGKHAVSTVLPFYNFVTSIIFMLLCT